jgi:hypothetical protein
MSHAATAHPKIENPGTLRASTTVTAFFGICVIIGLVAFFSTFATDSAHAWSAYLRAHFYFLAISLAAGVFIALQWLTSAMWTAPVLRVAEGFLAYVPFTLVSTIVLIFGAHHVLPWVDSAYMHTDAVLEGKIGYLNMTFWVIRTLVAVLGWIWFTRKLIAASESVDAGASYKTVYEKTRRIAVAFLMFFALSFSMASFDQLMSLDPHWFSTMFGVYIFAGAYQSFFALFGLTVIILKRAGYLNKVVNENHIHDIGKWMFAFTVFWAYTGFSQYMLYWYANLPEETGWFLLRFNAHWEAWTIGLFIAKFFVPFFLLLPRGNKRCEEVVFGAAIWILMTQYLDYNWLIQPQLFPDGPVFGFVDIGVWIGFLGVFGLLVTAFYRKRQLVFMKDPQLADSVYHHHI